MRTVIRPDDSTYESDVDYECPYCKEEEDIRVLETSLTSPAYKAGAKIIIICDNPKCRYYGSLDKESYVIMGPIKLT